MPGEGERIDLLGLRRRQAKRLLFVGITLWGSFVGIPGTVCRFGCRGVPVGLLWRAGWGLRRNGTVFRFGYIRSGIRFR